MITFHGITAPKHSHCILSIPFCPRYTCSLISGVTFTRESNVDYIIRKLNRIFVIVNSMMDCFELLNVCYTKYIFCLMLFLCLPAILYGFGRFRWVLIVRWFFACVCVPYHSIRLSKRAVIIAAPVAAVRRLVPLLWCVLKDVHGIRKIRWWYCDRMRLVCHRISHLWIHSIRHAFIKCHEQGKMGHGGQYLLTSSMGTREPH